MVARTSMSLTYYATIIPSSPLRCAWQLHYMHLISILVDFDIQMIKNTILYIDIYMSNSFKEVRTSYTFVADLCHLARFVTLSSVCVKRIFYYYVHTQPTLISYLFDEAGRYSNGSEKPLFNVICKHSDQRFNPNWSHNILCSTRDFSWWLRWKVLRYSVCMLHCSSYLLSITLFQRLHAQANRLKL